MGAQQARHCVQCGCRLARDNADRWCAPCRPSVSGGKGSLVVPPRIPEPIELPTVFWNDARVLEWCRDRDIGALLRLANRGYGVSQGRMAFWMSMEDGAVNKLIKGRNPDDTPAARVEKLDRWLRIADALHMPDRNRELIGLARKAPHTGLAQGLTPIDGPLTRSDMDSPNAPAYSLLDRTHEHSDMAANEGDGWAVRRASHVMDRSIEDFDRLLSGQVPAVSDKGRRIGAGTVADFSARAHGLRLADDLLAGKDLIEPALRELKACIRLCREADYTEEVGRSLLTVIGEISQIVGWIVSDAGRCRLAEDIYRIGMHAAHEAGDAVLEANLIGSLAYQVSNVGDPSEGVVLARAALKASGGNAPPRARALCWDRIAWAHAQTRRGSGGDECARRGWRGARPAR